jgi:hypothetical protein
VRKHHEDDVPEKLIGFLVNDLADLKLRFAEGDVALKALATPHENTRRSKRR